MKNGNIGIIGCGAMGSALAKGMIKRGGIDPASLYLFDLNSERQEQLPKNCRLFLPTGTANLLQHAVLSSLPLNRRIRRGSYTP